MGTAKAAFGTKLYRGDGGAAAATADYTHGSGDQQIVFTAVTAGAAGNSITVAIVQNATLSVSVVSTAITINADASSHTVNDVIAACYADDDCKALVDVTDGSGDGTGLITVLSETNLTGGSDSAEVFEEVENCTSFDISGISRGEIDVTSHSSTAGALETIAEGVYDPGSMSFTLFFDSSDSVHAAFEADFLTAVRGNYQLELPATVGVTYQFQAWVQDFSESYDIRGAIQKNVTLRLTGPRTTV